MQVPVDSAGWLIRVKQRNKIEKCMSLSPKSCSSLSKCKCLHNICAGIRNRILHGNTSYNCESGAILYMNIFVETSCMLLAMAIRFFIPQRNRKVVVRQEHEYTL